MTMITASTALTIFIMNIHFCGAEAKPVPHWAKVLIIDYMSKIFLVYEVGENCASSPSSSSSLSSSIPHSPQDDFHHQNFTPHMRGNGKLGGHISQEEKYRQHKHPRPQTSKPQHHPRVKAQHHITRDERNHLSNSSPGKYEGANRNIPMGDCCKEPQKVPCCPEDQKPPCCPEDQKPPCCPEDQKPPCCPEDQKPPCCPEDQKPPCCPEDQKPPCCPEDQKPPVQGPTTITFGPCVFCSHADVDAKLVRNVEYIANCFREQRATCAKAAEWNKVAKVMDRFFMWIFFIMVFLMSILIIGKAP